MNFDYYLTILLVKIQKLGFTEVVVIQMVIGGLLVLAIHYIAHDIISV